MKTEQAMQILADNLKALKEAHNLGSGVAVEKRSGLSKAQVNNLIALKHAATLRTLCLLGEGFNVPIWSLIHEDGARLYKSPDLLRIIDCYAAASEEGRSQILRVAEFEARYSGG